MRLPGVCIACHRPVVYNGVAWCNERRRGGGMRKHHCTPRPPRCGKLTRFGDPCARAWGHELEHRSLYAINNDRVARGLVAYDGGAETSSVPTYESVGLPLVSVAGRPTHLP